VEVMDAVEGGERSGSKALSDIECNRVEDFGDPRPVPMSKRENFAIRGKE